MIFYKQLDQTELKNNKYDMKQTGFVEWVVTLRDGSIRRFWAIQMYFVDQGLRYISDRLFLITVYCYI